MDRIGPHPVRPCDAAGIVYFPRYFEIVHGLIEDWLEEALGVSPGDMTGPRRTGLGYAHATADYFTPGFEGDRLQATVLLGRIGRSSMQIKVPVYCDTKAILLANLIIVRRLPPRTRSSRCPMT